MSKYEKIITIIGAAILIVLALFMTITINNLCDKDNYTRNALLMEEAPTNTSIHTEKEDYIESLVSYFNEQEEMEFMIYLYNNYPEIFYDILSFYENQEVSK